MIFVRLGEDGKDRGVPLLQTLFEKLETQLETVQRTNPS